MISPQGSETNDGADPSRQAIGLRLNESFEEFLKTLLGHVISLKVNADIEAGKFVALDFRSYPRVLVQDSTIIKLPVALFPEFPGSLQWNFHRLQRPNPGGLRSNQRKNHRFFNRSLQQERPCRRCE
jgi:hypothetical protein